MDYNSNFTYIFLWLKFFFVFFLNFIIFTLGWFGTNDLLRLALHEILIVSRQKFDAWLMLSLAKKNNQFHWFKIIKSLGINSKLANSMIDLNEKEKELMMLIKKRAIICGKSSNCRNICATTSDLNRFPFLVPLESSQHKLSSLVARVDGGSLVCLR